MTKKFLFSLVALLFLFSGVASAQQGPCDNYNRISSAVISTSTATTTAIITNTDTTKKTIICGWNFHIAGVVTTAQTVVFEYGTGATCGTGTVALTGAMMGTTTAGIPIVNIEEFPSTSVIPVGNNLCMVTTAAGIVAGSLTYVIQ